MTTRRREEFKINHADTRKNIGIGVALPFNAPSVFKVNYTTSDQVKSNLINLLLTNRGERPFNPRFYTGLRRKLFEPDSALEEIKSIINEKVSFYIPKIILNNIEVIKEPNSYSVFIRLEYSLNNQDDTVTRQFKDAAGD